MAVPDVQSLLWPCLRAHEDRQPHMAAELRELVAEQLRLLPGMGLLARCAPSARRPAGREADALNGPAHRPSVRRALSFNACFAKRYGLPVLQGGVDGASG